MNPSSDDPYAQRHDEALTTFDQWSAESLEDAEKRRELLRLEQFVRNLHLRTPRVWATHVLVAMNVAVFALMVLRGEGLWSPTGDALIAWGANYGPRTLAGDWWRLLTSTFLHIGIIHLAVNMWALWAVGRMVERLVGNTGFLAMYLVSGLAGSVASVAWNPQVLSAGASGAVFGVFGALLGFILWHRHAIPPPIFLEIRNSTLACLGFNLAFSFSVPGIDKAAHVGGMIAGFLCGLIMSQPLELATPGRRLVRNLVVVLGGLAALAAAIHLLPAAPPDRLAQEFRARDELRRFSSEEGQLIDAYNAAVRKHKEGQLSLTGFADAIDQEILPRWREACGRLESLDPTPERAPDIARLVKYGRLRQQGWELLAEGLRSGDENKLAEALKKAREADEAAKGKEK